ncbi:hypothetical protein NKG94_15975 [Micromonospora sp. M12]
MPSASSRCPAEASGVGGRRPDHRRPTALRGRARRGAASPYPDPPAGGDQGLFQGDPGHLVGLPPGGRHELGDERDGRPVGGHHALLQQRPGRVLACPPALHQEGAGCLGLPL